MGMEPVDEWLYLGCGGRIKVRDMQDPGRTVDVLGRVGVPAREPIQTVPVLLHTGFHCCLGC